MIRNWHIVTCEYPPQVGGVGDYTRLLAKELVRAGDEVYVWGPHCEGEPQFNQRVRRTLGTFGAEDFERTDSELEKFPAPRTLLLQWVPHGYGKKSMNLGFCRWIASRARRGDQVWLMVHEPFLEFGHSVKQTIAATVHRFMIRTLLRDSSRVFLSIPAWENFLRPYSPAGQDFEWLPIPATVPVLTNAPGTAAVRQKLGSPRLVIGHLGTYVRHVTKLLDRPLISVLRALPEVCALLLGRGSTEHASRLNRDASDVGDRIHAAGTLDDAGLSQHLGACDVMLQPFPDGLSSRRTSLMNALSHGIAVVSNTGRLSEDLWRGSKAIALGANSTGLARLCTELLTDPVARGNLARAGRQFYLDQFDWPRVVSALRSAPEPYRARAAHAE